VTRQEIDMELIRQIRQVNQKACTDLFNYYYAPIFHYCYLSVRNRHDAEDLTMIIFEKVFSKLEKYRPTFTFNTWLSKVARNTILDFIAWKKRKPELVDVSNFSHLHSQAINPERQMISEETVLQMRCVINAMSVGRKSVVNLRDEGLLCREVAEKLGVSINTVVGQLRYAKKLLNKKLEL
jgi:RNA polymerase sigma-70 factor (ECF subfamily)